MRRNLTFVLAGLLVVVATGLGIVMLSGGLTAHAAGSTTVYRATADLAPGTPATKLSERTIEKVQVDASVVPAGAVTDLQTLAGDKAVQTIFRGQVLISQQWSENGATGGLPIPPNMNAIAVQVSDQERVAGFIQPGSNVVVYATVGEKTTMILKNVQVLAIGSSAAGAPTGTTAGDAEVQNTIVTLALNAADSSKLVNAKETGTVHLGLMSAGS